MVQHTVGRATWQLPAGAPGHIPSASNPPPQMQKATFLPMTWILGGLGAVGVPGSHTGRGSSRVWAAQHHIQLAWDWHPWVISDGGAVPDRILCSGSGNKPVVLSLSLHLFQHSWAGPWKFPIF